MREINYGEYYARTRRQHISVGDCLVDLGNGNRVLALQQEKVHSFPNNKFNSSYASVTYYACATVKDPQGESDLNQYKPWREDKKIEQILYFSKIAYENQKDAAKVSISLSESIWKTGASFVAGPISAEVKAGVGNITGKLTNEDISFSVKIVDAKIKVNVENDLSIQAKGSIGNAKVSINEDLKVKPSGSILEGSASVQTSVAGRDIKIERNASLSMEGNADSGRDVIITDKSNLGVGIEYGKVKAEILLNLDKIGNWIVAVLSLLGAAITPNIEIKIPVEVEKNLNR